jgi:hypothetical protein
VDHLSEKNCGKLWFLFFILIMMIVNAELANMSIVWWRSFGWEAAHRQTGAQILGCMKKGP